MGTEMWVGVASLTGVATLAFSLWAMLRKERSAKELKDALNVAKNIQSTFETQAGINDTVAGAWKECESRCTELRVEVDGLRKQVATVLSENYRLTSENLRLKATING